MEIARDLRPTGAGGAVRVDQSLRIDFEMGVRCGVDVGGLAGVGDASTLAQQEAARLTRMRCGSGGTHRGEGLACHFDLHHAKP